MMTLRFSSNLMIQGTESFIANGWNYETSRLEKLKFKKPSSIKKIKITAT